MCENTDKDEDGHDSEDDEYEKDNRDYVDDEEDDDDDEDDDEDDKDDEDGYDYEYDVDDVLVTLQRFRNTVLKLWRWAKNLMFFGLPLEHHN